MILDSTLLKLEAVLAGAHASLDPEVIVDYKEWNTKGEETPPSTFRVALNGNTDVTILAAPAVAGVRRQPIRISIYNKDTASVTVTVKTDDATTERIIIKAVLLTLESLHWDEANGWYALDASGNIKQNSGNAFSTITVTGAVIEPKRASVYQYTAWDPSDVVGSATNASNSAGATSPAATYITVANSSGTTTWTAVVGGLYRFSIEMQNESVAAATILNMLAALGGTGTIYLGTATPVSITAGASLANDQIGGSAVFYAALAAGQTVTVLPKVAVTSAGLTTNFTTQATVSAEYCGAT